MKKIIDYRLVSVGFMSNNDMLDLLGKGYEPYGNPFDGDKYILQAMVKYEVKVISKEEDCRHYTTFIDEDGWLFCTKCRVQVKDQCVGDAQMYGVKCGCVKCK